MTRAHRPPTGDGRLSPQAEAALGRLRAELGRERYEAAQLPGPTALDHVQGSLGLPVVLEHGGQARPWMTWAFAALAVVLGARARWRQSEEEWSSPPLALQFEATPEALVEPTSDGALFERALESAFTPASWPALFIGAYFFLLFASRAEHLLGRARVAGLFAGGLLAAALAQLPQLDGAELPPAFLLGATGASAAFTVLRAPRTRVAVLLGMGWGVLRLGDDAWLRLPLWFWALLAAGQQFLFASVLGFEPLTPLLAAALVGAAAAAPALARSWRSPAQPRPSTRL